MNTAGLLKFLFLIFQYQIILIKPVCCSFQSCQPELLFVHANLYYSLHAFHSKCEKAFAPFLFIKLHLFILLRIASCLRKKGLLMHENKWSAG